MITNNKNIAETYLEYLNREIAHKSALIDSKRQVLQLHWGGGTPNYLSLDQVGNLWDQINRHFDFDSKAEISLEINPKYVDRNYILFLKSLGFNRISFGIQDFNPQVQQAVNRVQPEKMLMDHFAKPEDELAIAQQQKSLKRNFQGYTTYPQAELFGFGATSIGMLLQRIAFRVRYSLRGCKDVTCNFSTPARTFGVPLKAAIRYTRVF